MSTKKLGLKLRLISKARRRRAPRWVDIKAFGLKRARTRRITVPGLRRWRRDKLKI